MGVEETGGGHGTASALSIQAKGSSIKDFSYFQSSFLKFIFHYFLFHFIARKCHANKLFVNMIENLNVVFKSNSLLHV